MRISKQGGGWLHVFMKDEFYENVLKMFTGTAGAYVFWALSMLAVGRLYDPAYFGGGQLFVSAASVLAVVATGRYEAALTIPRFHFQAMQLLLFSAMLSLLCSIGTFLFFFCFSDAIAKLLGISIVNLLLAPVYMLELCFYVLAYGWMVRTKQYNVAARGLVLFPVSYLVFCVAVHPMELSMHKLALAIFLARGVEILYYGYYLCKDLRTYVYKLPWQSVWHRGKEYIDFPKYMLLGNFIDMAAVHTVPFLVTAFWGLEETGYYSMAAQVLTAPAGLIAKAVGDVFRQEGARLYGKYKECKSFYKKNLRLCLAYSAVVCITIYLAVPILLPMFLGEKWNIASQYVQWMLPMTFFVLLASPLSVMYIIARRQKTYLIMQILALLAVIVGLGGAGRQGDGIGTALFVWSILSMAVRAFSIYRGWTIAEGEKV